MDEKQYVMTPEMVYGDDWMKQHADQLEKWEWDFRPCQSGELLVPVSGGWKEVRLLFSSSDASPLIILLRRKVPPIPPAPQLREMYGKDRVEIPLDKEWTGEFRASSTPTCWIGIAGDVYDNRYITEPRLILRDRTPPTRVWYRAEDRLRPAKVGELVWSILKDRWVEVPKAWVNDDGYTGALYLCATRHEEPDLTPTVVTQADVDREWAKQHGGGE